MRSLKFISDYEFLLENCCNIGTTRAKQLKNAECIIQNTYFDQFTTNSEYKTQCETVMKICCIKEHHKYNCEKGKSFASTTNDCSQLDKIVLTQVGNNSAFECCLGCKLGILAAKENFPCTFNAHGSFGLGNPWEDIYYECCNTAKNQNRNDNNAQLIKRKGEKAFYQYILLYFHLISFQDQELAYVMLNHFHVHIIVMIQEQNLVLFNVLVSKDINWLATVEIVLTLMNVKMGQMIAIRCMKTALTSLVIMNALKNHLNQLDKIQSDF